MMNQPMSWKILILILLLKMKEMHAELTKYDNDRGKGPSDREKIFEREMHWATLCFYGKCT